MCSGSGSCPSYQFIGVGVLEEVVVDVHPGGLLVEEPVAADPDVVGELAGAGVVAHEGRLDDAPLLVAQPCDDVDEDPALVVPFPVPGARGQDRQPARDGEGLHHGVSFRVPQPVAGFVVEDFAIGLALHHLGVVDRGEELGLGIGDITHGGEGDGFEVGVLLRAVGFGRNVHSPVAVPGADQFLQGAVVEFILHGGDPA